MMKKVLEYQQRMGLIEDGDRIVAGFSGGADSVCLLLVLEELKKEKDFSFCAVHVEHGIRGEESLADAAFAEAFCEKRGITMYIYHVDAPKRAQEKKISLEEAARELRYECFRAAQAAYDGNKVAVAHHQDDNAETMLFHLVRGTGLRGLAGISPKREGIIRPLLCVTREEVEEFLSREQEGYCIDSTNVDVTYTRNRMRQEVLPPLRKINARAIEHMCALSEQVEELYAYVSRAAWEAGVSALQQVSGDEIWLNKQHIAAMDPVLQREFLYQVLGKAAGSKKDLGIIHVESLRNLFSMDTGKQCNLPYGLIGIVDYEVVVLKKSQPLETSIQSQNGHSNQQSIQPPKKGAGISLEKYIQNQEPLVLENGEKISFQIIDFDGDCEKIPEKSYTKWFDYDKIKSNVFLRGRAEGDYLIINQQGNQKKLKEYFINEKIPRAQRDQIGLLADDSHIMWVIGYRISEGYKVTPQTKRILEVRIEKENEYERNDSSDVYRRTGNI